MNNKLSIIASRQNQDINTILSHSMATNTRIAYEKGWNRFVRYCMENKIQSLPASPMQVSEYLAYIGNNPIGAHGKMLSIGTIIVNVSAINKVHIMSGHSSPTHSPEVQLILSGLKRMRGNKVRRVIALRQHQIKAMLNCCSNNITGLRDAAILALGFSAALRRSEIVNLQVADIEYVTKLGKSMGIVVTIRKSKTDQEAKGQKVAVPHGSHLRTIERIERWLNATGITEGYLFTTVSKSGIKNNPLYHGDIPRIIKHYAAMIGIDPSKVAGHSLRAGFVTNAVMHNSRLDKIMEVTRHKNPHTVLQYMRDSEVFDNHAGKDFL